MTTHDSDPEQTLREEEERLSARGIHMLTGGLTTQGDAFLVGVGAVVLFGCFYPLIGAWALLSFPLVLVVAVLLRAALR